MSALTYVLAEMASGHDGDFDRGLRLIDVARDCGAQAVKAQYWSDPDALADRRHVGRHYRAIYHQYAVPLDWIARWSAATRADGLEFICTAYLPADFVAIASFCDRLKVASFEAGADDVLEAVDATGKSWIISVGMQTERQLNKTENYCCDSTLSDADLWMLHCVSAYPAPMEALNLAVIGEYSLDGFSDHSANVLTGALAVAAGARVLEVHVRLDDTDPSNPDYACALDPDQFRQYVANVRLAERAMGDGLKAIQPCEREMARYRVRG